MMQPDKIGTVIMALDGSAEQRIFSNDRYVRVLL